MSKSERQKCSKVIEYVPAFNGYSLASSTLFTFLAVTFVFSYVLYDVGDHVSPDSGMILVLAQICDTDDADGCPFCNVRFQCFGHVQLVGRRIAKCGRGGSAISAGWGTTNEKTGLVDLIEMEKAEFTGPAMTPTFYRFQKISFSQPMGIDGGGCFLVCGSNHFYRIQMFGIVKKLCGRNGSIVILVIIAFWILTVGRYLDYTHVARIRGLNSGLALSAALNTFLSTPKEKSFTGKIHSRFFTSLFLVLILRGFFKSGLIRTFSPLRKYPFESLSQMGDRISDGEWSFSVYSKKSSLFGRLERALFKDLVEGIKRKNYDWRDEVKETGSSIADYLSETAKAIFYRDKVHINYLLHTRPDLDCICDTLGTYEEGISYAMGVPKNRKPLLEKIDSAVLRIIETGNYEYYRRKYELVVNDEIDSQNLGRASSGKIGKKKESLALTPLYPVFMLYTISLFVSFLVVLVEIAYHKYS